MTAAAAHEPVLRDAVVAALAPARGGVHVDGTLGAGGYTRALLEGGAARVIAIDRDPDAIAAARGWADDWGDRLTLVHARFGALDVVAAEHGAPGVDGVALDVGVSSMQLDQAPRGFSFLRDGPLDMRMAQDGPTAADLIAQADEATLTDLLRRYGEERAARRIARAILAARAEEPIETTARLAAVVAEALPPHRPGQIHPATRTFQALRIAVNEELDELADALAAAERALAPGGVLAVVSFHSLEDRIVKRFLRERSGRAPNASRHAPAASGPPPSFEPLSHGVQTPDEAEIARNPRARSARLRAARRTEAAPDPAARDAPTRRERRR
jgi:16S rRNA (cytosine1402-N4)-methyltransferase